jgi:hypothetical protein
MAAKTKESKGKETEGGVGESMAWCVLRVGSMKINSRWMLGMASLVLVASVGCSDAGGVGEEEPGEETSSEEALTGSYKVGTELFTTTDVNLRKDAGTQYAVIAVIPGGTRVLSASANPKNGWYGVTTSKGTGWMHGNYLTTKAPGGGSSTGAWTISAKGQEQMERVVKFAYANNKGSSTGKCFEYVWSYLWKSGYGKIDDYNDAPDMPSAYARNFAEYMNQGNNAAKWGLQRLPITNPYDAPRGSVVVVAAGSPGTAHPTAGDITIAAGNGVFINDGPYMGYGGSRQAFINGGGKVLGIYAPL